MLKIHLVINWFSNTELLRVESRSSENQLLMHNLKSSCEFIGELNTFFAISIIENALPIFDSYS